MLVTGAPAERVPKGATGNRSTLADSSGSRACSRAFSCQARRGSLAGCCASWSCRQRCIKRASGPADATLSN